MSELNTEVNSVESRSAVSWAAIFAGAVGAAALSLLMLILGTGLGLSVVSPWSLEGIGVSTLGFAAIAWLSFTQLAASGMGGYLAGRLRTKWPSVHNDEVYFRDTAHGFLTWAVASLLVVVLLAAGVGSLISVGATEATDEVTTYAALWMFVALLIGAFVASLMAVFGGRQRDAA